MTATSSEIKTAIKSLSRDKSTGKVDESANQIEPSKSGVRVRKRDIVKKAYQDIKQTK